MFKRKDVYIPLIKYLSDGKERSNKEIHSYLEEYFKLTEENKKKRSASGNIIYIGRINWGITDLSYYNEIKLIERVSRGVVKITERGMEIAKNDKLFEKWYQEYIALGKKHIKEISKIKYQDETDNQIEILNDTKTPNELIDELHSDLEERLIQQILDEIKIQTPQFFEYLVLKLLEKMGYGVNGKNELTQNGADGGIDGIITEDELGLSKIYLQAKRWEGNVSRPELQKFVGAISDKSTKKGVFITTSDFTKEAVEYVNKLQQQTVVLINGKRLANLMIKFKVGVYVEQIVELCKIDTDFFDY